MFHLKICKETIYDEIKRILRVLIIFFRDGDQNMMLLMFTEKRKTQNRRNQNQPLECLLHKKTANDNSNNFNNKVIASWSIYIMVKKEFNSKIRDNQTKKNNLHLVWGGEPCRKFKK